jgi:polyphosphate:AMP phosphotransferase
VVALEKMLVADGVLLRKYWLHLSQEQHGERLARIEASPAERWRLQPEDWLAHARYGAYAAAAHEMLEASHHADAPWVLVDAADARYRDITVGESLLAAFQRRAERPAVPPPTDRALATQEWTNPIANVARVDLVDKDAYEAELAELQGRLGRLGRAMSRVGRSLVLVFEGQDAAGKGGSIRRLTGGLDSRLYRVHATSAPTPEERGFPWLWRFWKHLPRRGNTAIFDRSWYGRVLVERVEGLASVPDWERAYEEIREFERQLVTAGAVVVKFWLAVSFDEQLRRFEDRESSGAKRHKLTDEDWRNREKWGEYEAAAVEMYHRTHRADAPWYIIDADHKRYARLCVLRAVCEEIERRLELGMLPPSARF